MTIRNGTSENDELDFRDSSDRNLEIYGFEGDDLIFGSDGDDIIDGGEDDDEISGEDGRDTLLGSSGNDTIYGRDDDDRLIGEGGSDRLSGGRGADVYFYRSVSDMQGDYIDFSIAEGDVIEINGNEFGIGSGDEDLFSYDSNSGELSFRGDRIAELPTGLDFKPDVDINIV
jgi:Ca2+-binding RTX toxin-like protein